MTKDLSLVLLGVWVALLPFLGFPNRWDTFILFVSGALIVVLVVSLRRDFVRTLEGLKADRMQEEKNVFVESFVSDSEGVRAQEVSSQQANNARISPRLAKKEGRKVVVNEISEDTAS